MGVKSVSVAMSRYSHCFTLVLYYLSDILSTPSAMRIVPRVVAAQLSVGPASIYHQIHAPFGRTLSRRRIYPTPPS